MALILNAHTKAHIYSYGKKQKSLSQNKTKKRKATDVRNKYSTAQMHDMTNADSVQSASGGYGLLYSVMHHKELTAAHAVASLDHYRLSSVQIKKYRAQANADPVKGNERKRSVFEELALAKQRELSLQ